MFATAAEVQGDLGKYVGLAANQEVIITDNGLPVARLLGVKEKTSFLSDRLVGLIPRDVDEGLAKSERLARQ